MQIGDTAQLARWFCDEDGPLVVKEWKKTGCREHMDQSAELHGVHLGKIEFYELDPGDEQAGYPPEDKSGTDWKLVVAEAKVVAHRPKENHVTFIQDLDPKDLVTLRNITRTAYARYQPASLHYLSDEACDEIIEGLSCDVIEAMISEAYHATKH